MADLTYLLYIYLAAANIVSFVMFGIDKSRAKRRAWRISEAALLISAAVGGSVGAIAGMIVFRHKTKHLKFTIGVPVILGLQIFLGVNFFIASQ